MSSEKIADMSARISRLLALRLGARGATLEARVAHRARALPRKVRRAALVLAEAERRAQVPKIARQLDMRALERAYATCRGYLEPLGSGARLRAAALGVGSSLAFVIVVLGVALLGGLLWTGRI